MIMETPAAIEKDAVAEGMSRMMGREVKEHITTQARPCDMLVAFCNNTLAGSKKSAPPAERTLADISLATIHD
jgi:hypothetical protein